MRLDDLHEHGTYACLKLDDTSIDLLTHLIDVLDVENSIHPDDFHTTLIYSRKPCADAMEHHGREIEINGVIRNLTTWPSRSGSNCLVALIDSEDVMNLNEQFTNDYGATSDYPEYNPHLSLSYSCRNKKYELPDEIPVKFIKIHVEPLKE